MAEPDSGQQLHPPVVHLDAAAAAKPAPAVASTTGAIPMSMPSILRNPQLKHLNGLTRAAAPPNRLGAAASAARPPRDVSKRKARRAENARLAGNPHVVRPTAADFRLHANPRTPTFSSTSYLKAGSTSKPTSLPIPQYGSARAAEPCYDASSASSGQFKMSLKDARKVLSDRINVDRERFSTQGDGPVERTVWKAEEEIKAWLEETVFLGPDAKQPRTGRILVDHDYRIVAQDEDDQANTSERDNGAAQIVEVQRTPNALVWSIPDPFLRLAVHCLARIYGCPSFSKDAGSISSTSAAAGQNRQTWILNPNPMARGSRRRGRRAAGSAEDRRRSGSVSTVASSNVLGGPGVGPQATRAAQIAGGIVTPPTTDLDSRDGGSVRAWNPDDDTEDPGSMSSSAVSLDEIGALGRDTILEETSSELSGSEAEEANQVERRVRRWARHSELHAHRLETPLEASEDDDGSGGSDDDEVGDTTLVPTDTRGTGLEHAATRDAASHGTNQDWEPVSASHWHDGDPDGHCDSDWAADHEDVGDSVSESDVEVASLTKSVEALDVQNQ
ncbi:hypothetical protein ACQY0O_005790 [Thecaphora frezii]